MGFSDEQISKEQVGILNYLPSSPSLRRRRNLTSVSPFCKAAPVPLFLAHNGLNELSEMHFEFPSILIDKSTMAFLTGQSWRVLKSWYTGGDPEQGFRHCFADGLNQRLISSSAQATLPYAQPHTQFWEWREKTLPVSKGSALGTRSPYVTVAFLAESSPLLSCASPLQVIPIERCCMWRSVKLNSRHRTFRTGSQNYSRESSVCKISIVVQVRYKFVFEVKNRFWWSEGENVSGY